MAIKEKSKTPKKKSGIDLMPIAIVLGIIGLAITGYIAHRASISPVKLFSVSLIALFAGLLFETFRVAGSWKKVVPIFIGSYFFSLINFLPGKNEGKYNFENHLESWPYFFILFYSFAFVFFHKNKVTPKLTEGITLLQSLSLVYWIIDFGFTGYDNAFALTLLTIVFLLSAFSVLNAFTNLHLSKTVRLILSVWSTMIMFALAIDNIFSVFNSPDMESSKYLSDSLYIGVQFFLLGVSAIYIIQNYILLAAFLPSKNGNYQNDLMENKKDHINRYSDEQVVIGHSLLCVLYAVILYGLNYSYQFLPRHSMIWLVFFTFPFILRLVDYVKALRKPSPI